MTYLSELQKEFTRLRDERTHNRYGYVYRNSIVKKSKVHRITKLRRYIARVRGEHVPNQKWMECIFAGRLNRTSWKCKGLPYISKARLIDAVIVLATINQQGEE